MNGSEAVTIAMRTFDRPVLLRRALASVAAQSFTDWRLIVLNNGGDADEVEAVVAAELPEPKGVVQVVHSDRRLLPGAAVNAALVEPLGDYVIVHDDDDTWHPDFLERAVGHMRAAEPDVGGVAVRIEAVEERVEDDDRVTELDRRAFNPNLERVTFGSALLSNPFPPIGFLIDSDAYREAGGYGERLQTAEDWALLLRILERRRVDVIREVLANYHLRPVGSGSYSNIVADAGRMRISDQRLIGHYLDDAMHRGELPSTRLSLAISDTDRQNHERLNELLDHVRLIHLMSGDIEFRSLQIKELLVNHDETFAAMRTVFWPITRIARATRGLRR